MKRNYDLNTLIKHVAKNTNYGAKRRKTIGKIPPKDLLLRIELQEYCCFYCGDKISMFSGQLDHFYPLSKGGEHYLYNLVWSCSTCNSIKRAHNPKSFCKKLYLDYEQTMQKLTELNVTQHKLTQFDDEYS